MEFQVWEKTPVHLVVTCDFSDTKKNRGQRSPPAVKFALMYADRTDDPADDLVTCSKPVETGKSDKLTCSMKISRPDSRQSLV